MRLLNMLRLALLSMANALFSIKPRFANSTLSGKKHFEFRKRNCRNLGSTMYIYATHPICNIIGEVTIVSCLSGSPEFLWEKDSDKKVGLRKEEFDNYFFGCKTAYAFELCNPIIYRYPISLSKINIVHPPQSFCYLDEQQCYRISFFSNHFE